MDIIRLDTTDSTNNWLTRHEKGMTSPLLVYCVNQTAGRGQRGNSWESQAGMNITASMLFHPKAFHAMHQFSISEAISLAIVEFLRDYGIDAKVKWPNDIYVDDKKISGILVEHTVNGYNITRSIAGFGININQTHFISDAPNPVSLKMLTGKNYDLPPLIDNLSLHLQNYLLLLSRRDFLHDSFLKILWRNDGEFHSFSDKKMNELIRAKIMTVAPEGYLCLELESGEVREYAFKEVEFIL